MKKTSDAFVIAKKVRARAHAPYSKFKVGAALEASNGVIYSGCNVENASYGGTVCAERVAILKAVSEGEKKFRSIVVVAESKKLVPPCAFCLQVMAEFCDPSFKVHLATPVGVKKTYLLSQLLPYPFNSKFF
jgi:cytidine deaminase